MNKNKTAALPVMLLAAFLAAGCASTTGAKQGEAKKSTGQMIDDATITSKVKAALLADPEVAGLKINVDTSNGKVTLKGEVKTMALWRKAESLARGVEGVQAVNNQLVITG
ncbi:MAG TPA: BON domain-containing protein [Noviherbaspirillum sp.]|nr:BON domain-containing protein [Noviherbaspirillum sp.]